MSQTVKPTQSLFHSGKFWIPAMMILGAIQVIVYKFQNTAYVFEGPFYKPNFHPYLQTINMFIGQVLSLPILFIMRRRNPMKYENREKDAVVQGKKLHPPKYLLLIPSIMDLMTSTMQFVALNFISTSAYQILKGGIIATAFLFTVIYLRQPIKRNELIGSVLAFSGIIVVGVGNVLGLEIVGYGLMIGSLFTSGFFFVYEQKLLQTYYIEPLQIVGYEGVFGFSIYLVLIPILCHIPCSFGPSACVYSVEGFPYFEGFGVFLTQIRDNWVLGFLCGITVFSILFFNVSGVYVTKWVNALARAIANMTKSILVWILGLAVTVIYGDIYPNLAWQRLDMGTILVQIAGFLFMLFGNFVYMGFIKIPGGKNDRENNPLLHSADELENDDNSIVKKSVESDI